MMFCHFWSKTPGRQAQAGGYVRCDTLREAMEFGAHCRRLGLAVQWRFR